MVPPRRLPALRYLLVLPTRHPARSLGRRTTNLSDSRFIICSGDAEHILYIIRARVFHGGRRTETGRCGQRSGSLGKHAAAATSGFRRRRRRRRRRTERCGSNSPSVRVTHTYIERTASTSDQKQVRARRERSATDKRAPCCECV